MSNFFECQKAAVVEAQKQLELLGERLVEWNPYLKVWCKELPSTCVEFYALEILKAIHRFQNDSVLYLKALSNERRRRDTP